MDEQKRAVHALNRLTFGPRPGDARTGDANRCRQVDRTRSSIPRKLTTLVSTRAWLRSARCAWTRARSSKISPTTRSSSRSRKARRPCRRDPARRAVYEAQVEKYEDKQDRKAAGDKTAEPARTVQPIASRASRLARNVHAGRWPPTRTAAKQRRPQTSSVRELLDLPPDERYREILKLPPEEQHVIATRARYHKPRAHRRHERRAEGNRAGAQQSRAGRGRRTDAGQAAARHLQRAAARGSDDRLLVQPLQCLHQQRRRPLSA